MLVHRQFDRYVQLTVRVGNVANPSHSREIAQCNRTGQPYSTGIIEITAPIVRDIPYSGRLTPFASRVSSHFAQSICSRVAAMYIATRAIAYRQL